MQKLESLKSVKFEPLSKSQMSTIRGGGNSVGMPNCSGGGGERKGFPEKGPNGTIRYIWLIWTSDDASGLVGATWEWGPYYVE